MRTKKEILNDIQKKQEELKTLQIELDATNKKTARDGRQAYKTKKAALDDASKIWEKMLGVGDVIKVTGTRTSPFRKVLKINQGKYYGERWSCGSVVTTVCRSNGKGEIVSCDDFNVITCATNKIVAHLVTDTEWQTYRDVVSYYKEEML